METVDIVYDDKNYTVEYVKKGDETERSFDVVVSDQDLQKYTGGFFSVKLREKENILEHGATNGPEDIKIRNEIMSKIFEQEGIDFLDPRL